MKGRVVLGLFIITQVVYLSMIMITLPQLRELSGGVDPFDMMPGGYDLEYAMTFLTMIGPEGRAFYLTRQIPLDMVYPGLFALTFAFVWRWLFTKTNYSPSLLRAGTLLPIFAGFADYAENGLIISMLTKFPDLPQSLVHAASLMTITKSVMTTLYFFVLFSLIIIIGLGKLRNKN